MTSTANQPTTTTAPNTSAASTAPSYASAAGASRRQSSTPLVVTGANPSMAPTSLASSTAQHAKSVAVANMKGQQSAYPAVPAIANGISSLNGDATSHGRNGSVTIAAPGNGYNYKAPAQSIQFGFDKTPQPTSAAPVSIPGAHYVPSPAHSPSPIPQPSASGGKPGATESAFKIGSFTNEGDRMYRPNMQMGFHHRRDSAVSQQSDIGHHGGPGPNRGGYPPQGRGRGFHPGFNNNGQMGFPPNQYPRGPPAGRGMPPQAFGRGNMQYPNSPQPARGSPAIPPAMPGGTPTLGSTIPVAPQYGPQIHNYAPPPGGPFPPQVNTPFTSSENSAPFGQKSSRKKGARWNSENRSSQFRQQDSFQPEVGARGRRHNNRRDSAGDYDRSSHGRSLPVNQQNFGYGGYDPTRAGHMAWPGYGGPNQQMYQSPGSPAPNAYTNPYAPPGSYVPPPAPTMSRGNSQMSERPASSTGNQGVMAMPGLPPKGPVIASSNPTTTQFVRPKGTTIKIKNAAGEEINLANLKDPASPAPSVQQTKTPPVIATTPTPPPKVGTSSSASHGRSESATKPAEDIRTAFMEQVKKSKEGDAVKTDGKPAIDIKAKSESPKQGTVTSPMEKTDEAAVRSSQLARTNTEAVASEKTDINPHEGSEATVQSKIEPGIVETAAKTDEKPTETKEEYLERVIREMEEEDARREAEQAVISARKEAEMEAAKKKAEEERNINAAENARKLREQEREMQRLEDMKEKARQEAGNTTSKSYPERPASKTSTNFVSQRKQDAVTNKLSINSASSSLISPGSAPSSAKSIGKDRRPPALNLAPTKTGTVEAPPPSAAMQALKSARFLTIKDEIKYPLGIHSPNPATNAAAAKKGGSLQYDSAFLLQFQKVFTEQPSVEFSQQVKALIGDTDGTRSASTKGSGAGGPGRAGSKPGTTLNFGSFSQVGAAKPLPSGTNSEQRFAISQGQIPRPASGIGFGRVVGNFTSASPMTRTASGLTMGGSRSGSRNQPRGGSKQGKVYETQVDAKRDKTMPLTQGIDLKPIAVSEKGWKPMSIRRAQEADAGGHHDPETVQRKVKAALNKMTPENFEKISKQILDIAAQSEAEDDGRTLRQVIQLTFEKATDESHWAAMYAKFCMRMLDKMSPEIKDLNIKDKNGVVVSGGALFRKYLLNRCQEDFQRGWNVDMPEPKEGESKEAAMLSDEYYRAAAIKRRGLGLVQFIGELFKLGMLTERIMHECICKLLDFKDEPDEHEIESLTKLLRTVGANLDNTEKGYPMMNAYFERISNMVENDLPSRLKFMLMDVIDLRKNHWESKEGLKGPKTLEEIRADAEAAAAAKAAEASRTNSRNQPGGRSQLGRGGDARHGYSNFQPARSNTVGMDDLRRLKDNASRTSSGQVTLGPSSMFNSRSNSGRKMGPGGALTRGNEDSAASSRAGTPPTQASVNAFAALANMETENPASPPSTAASPALNHAKPDVSA